MEGVLLTQINGGAFKCAYCRGSFRELRYTYEDETESVYFCLPECFVGYHWYTLGHGSESEEDRRGWMDDYAQNFHRKVQPAPFSCYLGQERRPREQWLAEDCRNEDVLSTEREQSLARLELCVSESNNDDDDGDDDKDDGEQKPMEF